MVDNLIEPIIMFHKVHPTDESMNQLTVLYSFNKRGFEADYWHAEIRAASTDSLKLIPFNHGSYIEPQRYIRAQLLDNLYFDRDHDLMRLYRDIESAIKAEHADVLLVDNCPPYHPDFLYSLNIYKVLRTSDGPLTSYERDIPYSHAYDHILYHSPAHSRELTMPEKLDYCRAHRHDFWPLGAFDAMCDPRVSESTLFSVSRDVEVVFVGTLNESKMGFLARVKKALGGRLVLYGQTSWKRNLYWQVKCGCPGWLYPLPFDGYVPLYQRTKIGLNIHNRGKYTVGNYRLFDLPANGVMQISDGEEYLKSFFDVGTEIIGYNQLDDLIDKVRYYLNNDDERIKIARRGYRRVLKDYRIRDLLHRLPLLLHPGLIAKSGNHLI